MLIQVKNTKDADRIFSILLHNGRFSELEGNRFRIDENVDEVLEKIRKQKIVIKKL